ncbi:MAG: hypothetical protein M3O02_06555 [Acidobacteriota bacterium]|nr:hypothetical protein [Acidobacteriota bacterium]
MKRRLIILLQLVFVLSPLGYAQVLVIANPALKAAALSRSELRDIFLGIASTLPDGTPVAPVLLKEGTVHRYFLSRFLGRSDTAFRANWRSLLFSGQAVLPRAFDSETALVEYVARTRGAIGYIGPNAPHERVKVIAVR